MARIIQWVLAVVLLALLSAAALEAAAAGRPAGEVKTALLLQRGERPVPVRAKGDLERTISVLQSRAGIARLPERTKEKLASLSDREFHLVTKLCDRIAASAETPGTDIALLLAAALIVLS